MVVVWNSENAAHLLRRAGFAAPPKAVKKALKKPIEKVVDQLFAEDGKESDGLKLKKNPGWGDLQYAWLERMLRTSSPLIEKLTLFWHNHFATAIEKVASVDLMLRQNKTLRSHGLGAFSKLALAMSRDPAMIRWLDNDSNTKANPNENFARELMELFTTGVLDRDGEKNYSEQDVVESARAFTGWTVSNNQFYFAHWNHDYGEKTFMGHTGPLDGTDVVEVLVALPATARRVCCKLWSFFAYPVELDDPLLDGFEAIYFEQGTKIEPILRAMFLHDEFYSAAAKGTRVKSPVEFMINALQLLGARLVPKNDPWHQLADQCAAMGQDLFNPPSVFGWKEGMSWVGPAGMLERLRVAEDLTSARSGDYVAYKPAKLLGKKSEYKGFTAAQTVERLLQQLGPLSVSASTRAALESYLLAGHDGVPVAEFVLDKDTVDQKVRGLLSIAMSLPEFQLH